MSHLDIAVCIDNNVRRIPPCVMLRDTDGMIFWSSLNDDQTLAYTRMLDH